MKLLPNHIVALTGAIVLCIGVCTPVTHVPILGLVKYGSIGKYNGYTVIALAIISVVIAMLKRFRWLLFTATAAPGVIIYSFVRLYMRIEDLKQYSVRQDINLMKKWFVIKIIDSMYSSKLLINVDSPSDLPCPRRSVRYTEKLYELSLVTT